ncbi:MAG: patatin-like phospholipase family protein, partial [Pyrinomonadaceae bacterium]|nr:patatin-like phospholipase family protein [Pyrinomonadaceae bacterium]
MFQRLHKHPAKDGSVPGDGDMGYGQAAICLSGGGIRSGTFALGLLQGLARYNLLEKFDYLSTVSGGGYIGGWLTAWLHRHQKELKGVTKDLGAVEPKSKIDPDPQTIQYLREYSNFLTPRAGMFTADTWAFIAIYIRNLILNWVVLFPLVLALLALPRLNVSLLMAQQGMGRWLGLGFPVRYIFLGIGSVLLIIALTYIIISRPAVSAKVIEYSRFWRYRLSQRHFLRWCLLPLVSSVFCLTTYWAWSSDVHEGVTSGRWPWFIVFGVIVTLSAWFISAISLGRLTHPKEMGKLELAELAILIAVGAGGGALLYFASEPIARRVANLGHIGPIEWYACYAVPLMLLVILLATTLFIGLTSQGVFHWSELLSDEDREWWARFGAWVLISIIAWAVFNTISIQGPYFLLMETGKITSVGGISGLISLLAGFSSKTSATTEQSSSKRGLLKSFLSEMLLPFLALLFLLVFLIAMSLLVTIILQQVAGLLPAWLYPMRAGFDYNLSLTPDAHMLVVHYSRLWFVSAFIVLGVVVSLLLGNRINLNKFSLHAGYRNRLIRGFLGASRVREMRRPNPFTGFDPEDNVQMHELRPVLFQEGDFTSLEGLAVQIGQATDRKSLSGRLKSWLKDETRIELESYSGGEPLSARLRMNLMEDLNTVLESELIITDAADPAGLRKLKKGEAALPQDYRMILQKRRVLRNAYPNEIKEKYPPPHRLLHVVNTSLNLVGGKRLAWQQRKAEPFVITPLHAGCFRVGYRRSRDYGGYRGISLGTAVAISGAAASSNMGYYTTSPVLSMVLTLFNVRLGWWLGNPGPAGDRTYHRESPRVSLRPVIDEAFGLTDDTNPYVYLTDGGHFENLALYEMVLRRCRLIVLSDAAADGDYQFNDLGNAVRKIRIDLGITIDFDEMKIFKDKPKDSSSNDYSYWAFGRIRYSYVDKITSGDEVMPAPDGLLIYIKPAVYGDAEPRDVLQYKMANEDFPHQSTGDQFFDEPQFESYRSLGWYIMNRI